MPIRPLPILATALLATATQLGCEDASARRAADAQRTIDDASRALRYAVLAPPPADDPEAIAVTRSALQKVASTLTGVNETPGQEAAAALLVSTVKRELATIGLAEAEALAAGHRRQRQILHGQIDAALRLDTLATSLERQVGGPHKTTLASARTDVSEQIQDLSRRIAELGAPIADRESQNRDERAIMAQLDGQAAQLRRQASESGHLAGLPTFEEAVRIEREADKYESLIAHRENDLQYDLRPEHELASTRVGFLQSMLNEIRSSEVSLDSRNDMRTTQVQQTRRAINTCRSEIQTALAKMGSVWSETLLPQYESALEHATAAVSQAKRASSKSAKDDRDGARLTLARAHELAANVHTSRARELSGQRLLLERMSAAGNTFGRGADYARTATELRTAEKEAIGQAEAQLQSAREQLEQVSSRDAAAEVSAFRQGIDERLQALAGGGADPVVSTPPPPAPATRVEGGARTSGGYESPEALLAAMEAVDAGDAATVNAYLDSIHTTTPATRRLLRVVRGGVDASAQFVQAMREQFGANAESAMAGAAGGMTPGVAGDVQLQEVGETEATAVATGPTGRSQTLRMIAIDGRWFIDGESVFAGTGGAAGEQMAAMADATQQVLASMAARVRAGEFPSAEAVTQTLMGELMSAMSAAPGK